MVTNVKKGSSSMSYSASLFPLHSTVASYMNTIVVRSLLLPFIWLQNIAREEDVALCTLHKNAAVIYDSCDIDKIHIKTDFVL